jgi:hypothetical protein
MHPTLHLLPDVLQHALCKNCNGCSDLCFEFIKHIHALTWTWPFLLPKRKSKWIRPWEWGGHEIGPLPIHWCVKSMLKESWTVWAKWTGALSSWRMRLLFLLNHGKPWPPLWSSGQSSWLQNGDVLCFLWGTNWIYICYVEESGAYRSVVVKALCYKLEGCRFDTQWGDFLNLPNTSGCTRPWGLLSL